MATITGKEMYPKTCTSGLAKSFAPYFQTAPPLCTHCHSVMFQCLSVNAASCLSRYFQITGARYFYKVHFTDDKKVASQLQ
jgi:hypothetical protein